MRCALKDITNSQKRGHRDFETHYEEEEDIGELVLDFPPEEAQPGGHIMEEDPSASRERPNRFSFSFSNHAILFA